MFVILLRVAFLLPPSLSFYELLVPITHDNAVFRSLIHK